MSTYNITYESPVSEIVSHISGATAIFRKNGLNFCCGGHKSLQEAALASNLCVDSIIKELKALSNPQLLEAPSEIPQLCRYIIERFHNAHKQNLEEIQRLTAKVNNRHGDNIAWPKELYDVVVELKKDMLDHIENKEVLFSIIEKGVYSHDIKEQIQGLMIKNYEQRAEFHNISQLTNNYTTPLGGCPTWKALYTTLQKCIEEDCMLNIHIENYKLFPMILDKFAE